MRSRHISPPSPQPSPPEAVGGGVIEANILGARRTCISNRLSTLYSVPERMIKKPFCPRLDKLRNIRPAHRKGNMMAETRLSRGLIQVYTGDGKGKTTCALGPGAPGGGGGVSGVHGAVHERPRDRGTEGCCGTPGPGPDHALLRPSGAGQSPGPGPGRPGPVREAWDLARQVILAGEHDLVILDEINLALTFNLLPQEEVLQVLRERPPWVEVVLTGRRPPRNWWSWRTWLRKCGR